LNEKGKLKKKILYSKENFQVSNQNNSILINFLMKKELKGLNDKLKGKEMNNDSISYISIILFYDNAIGLHLNGINFSHY